MLAYNSSTFGKQLSSYEHTGETYSESTLLFVKINGDRVFADYDAAGFPDCFMEKNNAPADPGLPGACPSNISYLRCSFLEKYDYVDAYGNQNIAIWNNEFQQKQNAWKREG